MDQDPVKLVHMTTAPVTLIFLHGQVRYAKQRGMAVEIISSPGPDLDAFGVEEDVPVHGITMPRRITPLQDLATVRRLVSALRRLRPRIVHAHTPKAGLLGMLAAWLARVPVRLYHIHGLPYMSATGRRRQLLMLTERVSCRLAHQVLCVSHGVREVAVADGICPAAKVKVLLGGSIGGVDALGRFDPSKLAPGAASAARARVGVPEDALLVGFVGRIVRDKGIEELARAWQSLKTDYPQAHLLLVGEFEPQDPISAAAEATLRSDPQVHLPGWVDQRELPALYAAMDVVVLPTYREGLPYVPLEAAAMARPVVATRIPGCVDAVVDGETGTLVPCQDVPALAEALGRYLSDPALRQRHGEAARARILRDFLPERICEATYQEYERLLQRR